MKNLTENTHTKTIEEIKGNKYNIWNCGFIKFKIDFSF